MNRIILYILATVLFVLMTMSSGASNNPLDKISTEKESRLVAKGIIECYILSSKQQSINPDLKIIEKEFLTFDYVKKNKDFFTKEIIEATVIAGSEFWKINNEENLLKKFSRKKLEEWQFEGLYIKPIKTPEAHIE